MSKKVNKQLAGFVDFVKEQGVVGLAVGLVLGGAVAKLVASLVENVVMPPVGLLLGSADGLKGLKIDLGTTSAGKEAVLYYGTFLNDFINFVIIAAVIYFIVHGLKLDKIDKKK